jgi:5-methylcytosine-specific restriction endonuclease McrA
MFGGASLAREPQHEYGDDLDWRRAHRELSRIAKEIAIHDFEQALWIVAAKKSHLHEKVGFASLHEYLERTFGYRPRFAIDKIRVAEALVELPEIAQALKDGVLTWTAVREIVRVATKVTEGEWLDALRGKSLREVEAEVRGRRQGDRPGECARPELVKRTIHVEVTPETFALWREAMMVLKKNAGGPLSEDEAIRTMARTALGGPKTGSRSTRDRGWPGSAGPGPRDESRSAYQIVVTRCADCGGTTQRGHGEEIDVAGHVLETAECDAQHVDLREAKPRATQNIPPAIRRQVWHRDHGHCVVPGCRLSTFVDVHHLQLRSEGGTHDLERMVVLCTAHHSRVHEGRLSITGTYSDGLRFQHADGAVYGSAVDAEQAAIMSDTFLALVELGFKQGESQRVLEAIRSAHVGPIQDFPTAIRLALRHLRQQA